MKHFRLIASAILQWVAITVFLVIASAGVVSLARSSNPAWAGLLLICYGILGFVMVMVATYNYWANK